MKSIPKPFTTARIIFDLMSEVYSSGVESDITDLNNFHGDPIPRSSMSMYIAKMTKEHFSGFRFYTRTLRHEGRVVMGCYNSDSRTENKNPAQPDEAKDAQTDDRDSVQCDKSAYYEFMDALK